MRKPKILNKYNLKPKDIQKATILNYDRLHEHPFWRNDVVQAWCLSDGSGSGLYGDWIDSYWIGLFGHSGDDEAWNDGVKEMLDDMDKRKIDMADEIMVVDVDDYIGESTKNQIEYAKSKGKFISFYNHPEFHYDDIGGFHDSGMGWNPNGNWCGECSKLSCRDCPNIKSKEE